MKKYHPTESVFLSDLQAYEVYAVLPTCIHRHSLNIVGVDARGLHSYVVQRCAFCPPPPSPNGIPPNNYTGLEQGPSRSTERDGRIIQWGDTMGGRAKGQTAAAQPY